MGKHYRYQRRRKWLRDPHCQVCGAATVLPEVVAEIYHCKPGSLKGVPAEMMARLATIHHARTRLDPLRGKVEEPCSRKLVCRRCNGLLGAQEEAALPIDELRRRARTGGENERQQARREKDAHQGLRQEQASAHFAEHSQAAE